MPDYALIEAGDPAPHFHSRSAGNPRYSFDTAAGRHIVLCFLGSSTHPAAQAALAAVFDRPGTFDDRHACFFGATADPADEAEGRLANRIPGYRFLWDSDRTAARAYGAAPAKGDGPYRPRWVLIDPSLRVVEVIAFAADGSDRARLAAALDSLPPVGEHTGTQVMAPILYLPRVFEPDLCRALVDLYDRHGGASSGFMRQVDGRTVGLNDPRHKSRRDCMVTDAELIATIQNRFRRRVVPEIAKAHQFQSTRMERYLVGCYTAEEGGHFAAHRDNTTSGTAHRRFAVSVNLNDDFEGGEVSFPEYGPRGFKAPPGGAVVFSCSLLHAVGRVTAGRRYAFLPFLYDDAAARIRDANRHLIGAAQAGDAAEATGTGNA